MLGLDQYCNIITDNTDIRIHYLKLLGTGKHWKVNCVVFPDFFLWGGGGKELPSMGRTSVDETLVIFIHTFK